MPHVSAWKEYQDKIAVFLSKLGFEARVDEPVQGARAKHDVDVTARMSIVGVNQLWVVECKSWKRRIPKERVLTFKGIVEDVGADRGLLFCEKGFQAGAIDATQHTNITLTSLANFEENFPVEVASMKAKVLDGKIATLMHAFSAIWDRPESERSTIFAHYSGPPGFPGSEGAAHAIIGVTARLSQMRQALEDARYGRWPVAYYPLDHKDGELFGVEHWDGLLFVVEKTLITCQRIHEHMITRGHHRIDWKDLEPPELTELLDVIRSSEGNTGL